MNLDGYVSPRGMAERIGVTQQIVTRWIRQGKVPAIRIGGRWRISEKTVRAFIGEE